MPQMYAHDRQFLWPRAGNYEVGTMKLHIIIAKKLDPGIKDMNE